MLLKLYVVGEEALIPGCRESMEEILVLFLPLNSLMSLQKWKSTGKLTLLHTSYRDVCLFGGRGYE